MAVSIAARLMTGNAPGSRRQTGQTWVFGGASAYSAEQPQYILIAGEELGVDLQPDDGLESRFTGYLARSPDMPSTKSATLPVGCPNQRSKRAAKFTILARQTVRVGKLPHFA